MEYSIDFERGIANRGNLSRIKNLMKRAVSGERLVIGFIGGSITQGCNSSTPETCYAYRVFSWWKNKFPNADFKYINGGIGGTTSQFAVARVYDDLLAFNPDFVVIEFSVNDESTEHFKETYEGLVRNIYAFENNPAMLIVHNVFYNNGSNAQLMHSRIGRHYQIPCVSMQSSIYAQVLAGKIENREITKDDLHPNDKGHDLVAKVITYFLDKVYDQMNEEENDVSIPKAITVNGYEKSVRYRNINIEPKLNGFVKDSEEQKGITDCFKLGWYANKKGDNIEFEIEGSGFAVQYRRYANKKGPIAKVVIDGEEENAKLLDASFDQDWGDNLELTTLVEHIGSKLHKVTISILDENNCEAPFYLVSVIATK